MLTKCAFSRSALIVVGYIYVVVELKIKIVIITCRYERDHF